jgi:hypothetical protein
MNVEQLKSRILSGQQQYWNREQLLELLNKLESKSPKPSNILTLFNE